MDFGWTKLIFSLYRIMRLGYEVLLKALSIMSLLIKVTGISKQCCQAFGREQVSCREDISADQVGNRECGS